MADLNPSESRPLRLVLADDHALVLEGLQALLATAPDMLVVAAATDGERLLEAVERFTPDVVVLDLEMPYLSGLTCLQRIREAKLPVRVLVLSAFGDADSIRAALEAQADGFALKTEPPQNTIAAIRQVASGQIVFPGAARRLISGGRAAGPSLTPREESVLALAAEGQSNAQIAQALSLTENTVKFHLQNIYQKLGVSNRTEAAAHFHRRRSGL